MSKNSSFVSDQSDPITVEAEYSIPGREETCEEQWTFYNRPPNAAEALVVQNLLPNDAKLWRTTYWVGLPGDR